MNIFMFVIKVDGRDVLAQMPLRRIIREQRLMDKHGTRFRYRIESLKSAHIKLVDIEAQAARL